VRERLCRQLFYLCVKNYDSEGYSMIASIFKYIFSSKKKVYL
jgi:hypothetical protein